LKRRPDHARNNWLEHIHQDSGISQSAIPWRRAIKRGHGATLRPRLQLRDDDDDDDDDVEPWPVLL